MALSDILCRLLLVAARQFPLAGAALFLLVPAGIRAVAKAHRADGNLLGLAWIVPIAGIFAAIAIFPPTAPDFWSHHYGGIANFWALAFLAPFFLQSAAGFAADALLYPLAWDDIACMILTGTAFAICRGVWLQQRHVFQADARLLPPSQHPAGLSDLFHDLFQFGGRQPGRAPRAAGQYADGRAGRRCLHGRYYHIDNAWNFMVKSIAGSCGVPMASFFDYIERSAVSLLSVFGNAARFFLGGGGKPWRNRDVLICGLAMRAAAKRRR